MGSTVPQLPFHPHISLLITCPSLSSQTFLFQLRCSLHFSHLSLLSSFALSSLSIGILLLSSYFLLLTFPLTQTSNLLRLLLFCSDVFPSFSPYFLPSYTGRLSSHMLLHSFRLPLLSPHIPLLLSTHPLPRPPLSSPIPLSILPFHPFLSARIHSIE